MLTEKDWRIIPGQPHVRECPNCGAIVTADTAKEKKRCPVCGKKLKKEEENVNDEYVAGEQMDLKKLIAANTPRIIIGGSYRDAAAAMSIYDKKHEYELDLMRSDVQTGWIYERRADAD